MGIQPVIFQVLFTRFVVACVLHTPSVSNVQIILCGDKGKKIVYYKLCEKIRKMQYLLYMLKVQDK